MKAMYDFKLDYSTSRLLVCMGLKIKLARNLPWPVEENPASAGDGDPRKTEKPSQRPNPHMHR